MYMSKQRKNRLIHAIFDRAERMMHHYYGQDKPYWFTDDVFDGFDADACKY